MLGIQVQRSQNPKARSLKENSSTFVELNTVNCLDGLLAELKQPVYHHQLPLGLEVCQVGWRASRCE